MPMRYRNRYNKIGNFVEQMRAHYATEFAGPHTVACDVAHASVIRVLRQQRSHVQFSLSFHRPNTAIGSIPTACCTQKPQRRPTARVRVGGVSAA